MALTTLTVELEAWQLRFDAENDAFDFIRGIDEDIATIEFTRRMYEYARDVLIGEGEEV